ncbi:glycosyltransferase [Psychroflexus sp. MES1-P1E]|uniref:glycosyltransferase n=1 Tax=Psychroflexus sp. MES1-P1E TaxID=2058320 RepID=UPI000C7D5990|nr:glycosyltransferase [Psychroflexus sp. MES1-P1E]PKG43435.1 glycosyltransferase family 4 protein [Psychroflexus sp. MES1-P1E]
MNIALLLEQKLDPNAGGVQRSTFKLVNIFQTYHHHSIIISVGKHTSRKENFEGITLYYVNIDQDIQLKNILENEEIDCVINQTGYSVGLTKLILKSKPSKTKIINTLRINPLNFYDNHQNIIQELFNRKKIGFLNTLLTRKLILSYHIIKQNIELSYIVKKTDAFVMLSERFKPELFFLAPPLRKNENKIFGIGNPFQRPEIDIKNLPKENIVLYVGRLNIQQKRVDLLLQIWKRLHAEAPDWNFWVLGEGQEKKKMKQFCEENNLDRITFFGKVNPNEYYEKAKIFHMTSAFEGFGNVLIEAQSYGCVPVLFDSYAAASDIVIQNKNGVLIPPFRIDEYVNQTKRLMNNPTELKKKSENGFENVLRFSYEKAYEKWEDVFKSLK